MVGVTLQAQGLKGGHTGFFEGDDLTVIDGKVVIRGTGSEETFNGGWYEVPGRWEDRVSLPLTGCLDYKKYLGRTGGYRWMIADAMPYKESIDFQYRTWAARESNSDGLYQCHILLFDGTAWRRHIVARPWPNGKSGRPIASSMFLVGTCPVRTFSLQNATLGKKMATIDGRTIRYLQFQATGRDIFGPHHVAFICDIPTDGRYKIQLKALKGPDQGIVRIYRHDSPVGQQVNLYAEEQCAVSDYLTLATLDMLEGDNPVFLVLTGKDERSTGLGFNAVELIAERVE